MKQKYIIIFGILGVLVLLLTFSFLNQKPDISTSNIPPAPTKYNFTAKPDGCHNIVVLRTNIDDTAAIIISLKKDRDNTSTPITLTIGQEPDLNVIIVEGNKVSEFYCNDVLTINMYKKEIAKAKSGIVTVQSNTEGVSQQDVKNGFYRVNVTLENAIFDKNGEEFKIDKLDFQNVLVGWVPG